MIETPKEKRNVQPSIKRNNSFWILLPNKNKSLLRDSFSPNFKSETCPLYNNTKLKRKILGRKKKTKKNTTIFNTSGKFDDFQAQAQFNF